MSIPPSLIHDQACTFLKREGHWRGGKLIQPQFCGDDSVVRLVAPITGDVYYMCKTHWDERAQSVAVDQRFQILKRVHGNYQSA